MSPETDVGGLSEELSATLAAIEEFARDHHSNYSADRFRKANQSLGADGDLLDEGRYFNDLAPAGSLTLPSRRLLACSEDAWVFAGKDPWNEETFEGKAGRCHRLLSERLFVLLNRSICAAVNASSRGA